MTMKTENLSDCSLQQGKAFSSIETQWSWDKMTGAVTGFSSMKACIILKFYRSFFLGWQNTTINVASQRQCPTLSPTLSPDAITKCQIHAQIISESLRSDLESLKFRCWISFVKLTIALLLLCPTVAVPTQWSRDKMAKFCRRLFHVHLRQWIFRYIGCNFIGPCYQRSNWQ